MSLHRVAICVLLLAACTQTPPVSPADVRQRYEAATQAYANDLAAFERTAAPGAVYQGNLAPLADFLRAAMRQRGDAETRELAAIDLATLRNYATPLTADDFTEIAAAVPANSPRWALLPQDAIRAVAEGLPPESARATLEAIATQNSDRAAQGWAIVYLAQLERREGNPEGFDAAYARLVPYAQEDGLRFAIRLLNPQNKVAVGKPAPPFAVREMGSERVISSESLRGRYYLLDFWATWCGPCVSERAIIARAQERFGSDRFTVVSISMDNTEENAIQFRQRRWPQRWLNLYAPGSHYSDEDFGFGGDVAQAYEITWIGLPQLVLVSPEGQVLALRDQLDGVMLERTLTQYLGAPG